MRAQAEWDGLLLIEDNEDEIAVMKRALKRLGLGGRVKILRDGQEAIDYLFDASSPAPVPRAIFLDLRMPRVDGWEVLRRIRSEERTRYVPVIVVSSSRSDSDVDRSYELGANSFLAKQFDSSSPGEYIVAAATYWLERNHSHS